MEERTCKCPGDFEVTAPTPDEILALRARGDDCPARAAFDRVGDRWSILVLYQLVGGPLRFNALRRRIDGLSQRVLTVTLRDLERDGFVTRTQYPTIPPQVDYRPTPLGRALLDAAAPLVAWVHGPPARHPRPPRRLRRPPPARNLGRGNTRRRRPLRPDDRATPHQFRALTAALRPARSHTRTPS